MPELIRLDDRRRLDDIMQRQTDYDNNMRRWENQQPRIVCTDEKIFLLPSGKELTHMTLDVVNAELNKAAREWEDKQPREEVLSDEEMSKNIEMHNRMFAETRRKYLEEEAAKKRRTRFNLIDLG